MCFRSISCALSTPPEPLPLQTLPGKPRSSALLDRRGPCLCVCLQASLHRFKEKKRERLLREQREVGRVSRAYWPCAVVCRRHEAVHLVSKGGRLLG